MTSVEGAAVRTVLVPPERVERWFANFERRNGPPEYDVREGRLVASAASGTTATASLPFDRHYAGEADAASFAASVPPVSLVWGLLLVRKGGFAVARVQSGRVVDSKVGRRHVQGRTKAGGQSQQRFARRRENQARAAYEAAADHAARILTADIAALVCGGDRAAVEEVLADPRLRHAGERRVSTWLPVPDPRRDVLELAVRQAQSATVVVDDHGAEPAVRPAAGPGHR